MHDVATTCLRTQVHLWSWHWPMIASYTACYWTKTAARSDRKPLSKEARAKFADFSLTCVKRSSLKWKVMLVSAEKSHVEAHSFLSSTVVRTLQSSGSNYLNAKTAEEAWLSSLRGIMQYVVAQDDLSLNEAWRAIHLIFNWVDQFNQRFLVSRGCSKKIFATRRLWCWFIGDFGYWLGFLQLDSLNFLEAG